MERNEAKVFCIAQIDCDEALTDSAYQTWITGLANNGQTHIQVQNFRGDLLFLIHYESAIERLKVDHNQFYTQFFSA